MAKTAQVQPPVLPIGPSVIDYPGLISGVGGAAGSALGSIFDPVKQALIRLGIGALGLTLMALGLLMIAGEASLSQAAARLGRELKGAIRVG